jgi:hypothetical protein
MGDAATDESVRFGINTDGTAYGWLQAVKPGTAFRDLILEPLGGKVGIGTTSPGGILSVGADSDSYFDTAAPNTLNFFYNADANTGGWINYRGYQGGITQFRDFSVGNGKGERICFFDGSTGRVGIGTTSPAETLHVEGGALFTAAGMAATVYRTSGTPTSDGFRFYSDVTSVGTHHMAIQCDGDLENTNNNYSGFSDLALKTNVTDANSQWDDIKALRVRHFELKANVSAGISKPMIGVIAQELEASGMSGLVKDSDSEDDEGTKYKSAKYSILYMKAVKALQEAMERIESLESKVEALENA